jgi:hypothetical protein
MLFTLSYQDVTQTGSIRHPTATENAPSNCVVPDSDLAAVVAAWPELPEAIRAGTLAMVRAASK